MMPCTAGRSVLQDATVRRRKRDPSLRIKKGAGANIPSAQGLNSGMPHRPARSTVVTTSRRLRHFVAGGRAATRSTDGQEVGSTSHRVLDGAECATGTCAQRGHDRDASHQDEGKHDSVFNRCWAVFTGEKPRN